MMQCNWFLSAGDAARQMPSGILLGLNPRYINLMSWMGAHWVQVVNLAPD